MAMTPDVLAKLNGLACEFYEQRLAESPAALAYLAERGISAETARAWRLGYAPGAPDERGRRDMFALSRFLSADGWGEATLIEAGLAVATERGGVIDVFRDRLIFPIPDPDWSRILAFGSRRLRDDEPAVPKYINSPRTVLFDKSETLYGWPNLADVRAAGEAFVVEGNFDMIGLWQAGVRNVLAVCGTAFTAEHLFALAEHVSRITFVLDADAAGQKATRRSLLIDGAHQFDLGVVTLAGGKDPDEIVREGRDAWDALVAARQSRWEYLWRQALAPHADALADDVEARVAWKDEWCELVRDNASSRDEGARLLGRMEHRLELAAGSLAAEYLAELDRPALDERPSDGDDLLLLALAERWDRLAPLAADVPFETQPAAGLRDEWLRRGAAALTPRLRFQAATKSGEAQAHWRVVFRARIRPRLLERHAELYRAALGERDEARRDALRAQAAEIKALISD